MMSKTFTMTFKMITVMLTIKITLITVMTAKAIITTQKITIMMIT